MAVRLCCDGDGDGELTVRLGQLPADWTRVDAATATWTVTLSKASCDVVRPVVPR